MDKVLSRSGTERPSKRGKIARSRRKSLCTVTVSVCHTWLKDYAPILTRYHSFIIPAIRYRAGNSRRGRDITVSPRAETWIKFDFSASMDVRQVVFTLPLAPVRFSGVLVNEVPNGLVYWPWSAGATVGWHVRGGAPKAVQTFLFTPEFLLHSWNVPPILAKIVRPRRPVLSDKGGIVLMVTHGEINVK